MTIAEVRSEAKFLTTLHLLALLLLPDSVAADQLHEQDALLEPVWTLDACNTEPTVVHNEFGTPSLAGFQFPLDVVRIVDPQNCGVPHIPVQMPFARLLRVSADGNIVDGSTSMCQVNVRFGPFGDEPIVVFDEVARNALGDAVSQFDPLVGIDRLELSFPGYMPSRIDGIGALFLKTRAVITGGTLLDDCLRIPICAAEVAFARDANIGAVVLLHFYPDQTRVDHQPLASSLWAFDFNGNVFYKSPEQPPQRGYGQLYVSNNGRWAMVTKQGPDITTIGTDEVVFIDLHTGETVRIDGMSGGYRYHSMDGRYMALAQHGWERIYFFDLASPSHPELLWTENGVGLASVAINQDGSLVAAMDNELVVLVDRSGRRVGRAPRHVTNGFGMMLAGDFLVVGMQYQSGLADFADALRVDVYHVGARR
jgi:hypothetical protein